MLTKEKLYSIENDLASRVGFFVPFNNIAIIDGESDVPTWTYIQRSKKIVASEPKNCSKEKYDAIIDFSIAHELCHMIQHFIIKENLDTNKIANMSLDEYNKRLNHFFDLKNIYIDNFMLQKFKNFIMSCPMLQHNSGIKKIKFDDFYYTNGDRTLLYDNIYHNNSTEILSNYFATTVLYDKYKSENNKTVAFMRAFAQEIESKVSLIKNDNKITREDFATQIIRSKGRLKSFLIGICSTFGFMKDYSPSYKKHNFDNCIQDINTQINTMKNDIDEINLTYKTDEEIFQKIAEKQKIIKELNEDKRSFEVPITIIDLYNPERCNDDKYEKIYCKTLNELKLKIYQNQITKDAVELVVDFEKQIIYKFKSERIVINSKNIDLIFSDLPSKDKDSERCKTHNTDIDFSER